ncbi:hypothetical protein [Algibacter agarivorans]|uniref:hypothetical protein n=1 Tax=Algibacter agarivorans TaxID=1109741 RepID=UPI0031E961A1
MIKQKLILLIVITTASITFGQKKEAPKSFPFSMPEQKPDMPLSAALQRNYDQYYGTHIGKLQLHLLEFQELKKLMTPFLLQIGIYQIFFMPLQKMVLFGKNKVLPFQDHLNLMLGGVL